MPQNQFQDTASEVATPLLQIYAAKLQIYAAWFLGLFGTVTLDKVVALSGLVLGVAGYMMNRHYKRKEDRRQAAAAKREEAQAERNHKAWVMDMLAKFPEEHLVQQLGKDWATFIPLPATGNTDLGGLSNE